LGSCCDPRAGARGPGRHRGRCPPRPRLYPPGPAPWLHHRGPTLHRTGRAALQLGRRTRRLSRPGSVGGSQST
jgi:hypothetical protein